MNINQNERKKIIQFFLNFIKPTVQDINKLKIEIIIEIIIALLPIGMPILVSEPDGATRFISKKSNKYDVIGIERGNDNKNNSEKIFVNLKFNLDLFLINGLRLEKSNEKDPTIKIIMKLISLIQKIKPKQIEIRSKFFFPSSPLRYLKI